ncbi:MAG: protein kinase [Pyrinomonadaceae bacterium]
MPKIGDNLAQYRIISAIGAGGMGEVFLAEDNSLGRKAALKFLSAEFASERDHLDRFFREARAASALNHPNICTVYEINETGETPFIAMEYIEGETVAAMIHRRRRNIRQTLDIAIQIAGALADAHENSIVHRDIKPANLIVNLRGQVKILDFGLAKKTAPDANEAANRQLTHAGVILGTASYMSPEQSRGLEVDSRSDIWSFGVCLYEMLTGNLPFTGETVTDTFAAILTHDPDKPSKHISEIPEELERIVLRTLQKERDSRYQSTHELLADLRRLNKRLEFDDSRSDPSVSFSDEKTEEFSSASTDYDIPRVTDEDLKKGNLRPNNLTATYSRIIGREDEIASISELLRRDEIRLVTMTGIGGTGKTTLSRAVAERMLIDFDDGVFFIEMATVTQQEAVASRIAQPLGIKEEGGRPALEMLKNYLRDKQMLLVIDNFEQVVDAAHQIAGLLTAAVRLKVLVTSREILHLQAETEFPVPPLDVPEGAAALRFEELRYNEAVLLFAERARITKPGFLVTEQNISDVAAICARLDGLPLAIELAAARVRILTPAAILSKLENRLNLLTAVPGTCLNASRRCAVPFCGATIY